MVCGPRCRPVLKRTAQSEPKPSRCAQWTEISAVFHESEMLSDAQLFAAPCILLGFLDISGVVFLLTLFSIGRVTQ